MVQARAARAEAGQSRRSPENVTTILFKFYRGLLGVQGALTRVARAEAGEAPKLSR